jgi:hypothetical protein
VELERTLVTLGRYLGASAGTLALHCAVAAALPVRDVPLERAEKPVMVWLEAGVSGMASTLGAGVSASPESLAGTSRVESKPARRPAKMRRVRARAQNHPAADLEHGGAHPVAPGDATMEPGAEPTTGDFGHAQASAPGARKSEELRSGATGGVPMASSAHGPGLLTTNSPCAGYFPHGARAKYGEVQLTVEVDEQGRARASAIVVEAPLGQGFGSAARSCAERLRFSPAVDAAGTPVYGHAKLKLRFDRATTSG